MILNMIFKSKNKSNNDTNIKKTLLKSIFSGLSIYVLILVLLNSTYIKGYINDYPIIGRLKIYLFILIFVDFVFLIINYNKLQ